ncbi:glycosyltransferase [Streptococcus parauberis]|uniref:glycosyltransferase n=1 Tax=Streptococcus parauberis TaxID=1348 RepID=UPI00379D07F4
MTKVLVVSYHYPPFEGSCSDKNQRIVKKLLSEGFEVLVLTKNALQDIDHRENNLTILRTKKNGLLHKSMNTVPNVSASSSKTTNYKKVVSDMMIPDSTIDWYPEAKNTFKANLDLFKNIDIVFSISSPYSAHLISAYIAKKIKRPYILSYGDPWIYEPKRKRGPIRYSIEKSIEKNLVKNASKVLVITDWNKEKYKELYDISDEKIATYHIGFDPTDQNNNILSSSQKNDNILNIVYGGSLDEVHRNPEPFLKAMKNIEGVNLSIYNSDNSKIKDLVEEYGIKDKVSIYPLVSSAEFNEILHQNDALLLFGNKTPFQVPGKVFNYIATEKTIIYVKNNQFDNDGTEKVLKDYDNYILTENNADSIISNINHFKNNNQNKELNISSFSYLQTMQPIVDCINDVLKENNE